MAHSVEGNMQSCALCGSADVPATREHVIPAWARRSFDIQGPIKVDRRDETATGPLVQVGKIQHLNITLDEAICKDCNTVWLSQLEREVRPFLAPMAASANPTTLDCWGLRSWRRGPSRPSCCSNCRCVRCTRADGRLEVT